MLTLHLGVNDLSYPNNRRGTSTGDVAEFLEARYGVMQAFWDHNGDRVAVYLEEGLAGTLESLMMGAPPTLDPFGKAMGETKERFSQFLSLQEVERIGLAGVPTQAAMRGVSHRFKRPYARREPRPSFVDSGLYESSFVSWVD